MASISSMFTDTKQSSSTIERIFFSEHAHENITFEELYNPQTCIAHFNQIIQLCFELISNISEK